MAHILLVEDDERLRALAAKVLGRSGHRLTFAVTGPEAVQLALDERPDLVLMDLSLPGFDGLEATRRVKAEAPALPVVMVTAHAMTGDEERARAAGCDGFLTKPYAIADLVACVESTLTDAPAGLS